MKKALIEQIEKLSKEKSSYLYRDRGDSAVQLKKFLDDKNMTFDVLIWIPNGAKEMLIAFSQTALVTLPCHTKKISLKEDKKFGIGALTLFGVPILNRQAIKFFEVTKKEIVSAVEFARCSQSLSTSIDIAAFKNIYKKNVLIIDDGVSTGYSIIAAYESLKVFKPNSIKVATPIISQNAFNLLYAKNIAVISPNIVNENFFVVDYYYASFNEVGL